LDEASRQRFLGRYAVDAPKLVAAAHPGELETIPGTQTHWVELRWAARAEGVVHLEDLLLRRVRVGHLLPRGGASLLPRIRTICQPELGWSDDRWATEQSAYLRLWDESYGLPDRSTIPDWREMLAEARARRRAAHPTRRRQAIKRSALASALVLLALLLTVVYVRFRKG
jgi:glycerol-3-phosphate dehydrogenase